MTALLLLLCSTANAADYSFKYGLSVPKEGYTLQYKVFGVKRVEEFGRHFIYQLEGALVNAPAFADNTALLASISLGVDVSPQPTGIYFRSVWGPAYYSRKDIFLGGPFQFNHDSSVGVRDATNHVECGYKHVSSAGIYNPNTGLDMIWCSLGTRF